MPVSLPEETPSKHKPIYVYAQRAVVMAGAGLILGALTVLGQATLPGSWNRFANSGAAWLLGAFLVGASMPSFRWAAAAGVVTLFGALTGYTLTTSAMGYPYTLSAFAFWGAIGLVGGPFFGMAGCGWRSQTLWLRVLALSLLGGVFIAEGWFMLTVNADPLAGWVSAGLGLGLALLLARSMRERLYTLLALLPITGLGMVVFTLIMAIT